MALDHRPFIERYQKKDKSLKAEAHYSQWLKVFVAFLILGLSTVAFVYIAMFLEVDEGARSVAPLALGFSLFIGFTAFFTFWGTFKQEKSFKLLKDAIDSGRGLRLITDEKQQTVFVNRRFEKLCDGIGLPRFETMLSLFRNLEESEIHFRFLMEQVERGLVDSVELLSKYNDQEHWFTITAQPIPGYPGYVHWRLDDVTQKHMIDKVIREEREKLIDFTDNAPVGFFSVDESGRFIFANATFARWLGEDLRVLLENGVLHTYLIDPPKDAQPYDLVEGNHTRQIVEVRMKSTAGRSFLASVNQVVMKNWDGTVRTRAVVYDLTSEREMRKALEASEDRFERFFEEAPLGIAQIDKERTILDCNQAFISLLGKTKQELLNVRLEQIISDGQALIIDALRRIEQGQDVELPLEVSFAGKRHKVVAHMYARKFEGSHDIVLHFINVTQQKTLEEQFVQSQKMQAIGQLAGGVAHDFNNLLTAIIGFCDLLFLRHKPGDPSFADIMQIKQNSNRAANLVRQLLAFSRQQTLRPRVQDITDILTELSHLLRRLIGASIDMELVHGHDLGLVKVDEGQMEQVLINMAVNARDAMNNVGTLTIETENYVNTAPRELVTEELPPDEWIVIKVTDTGCGIEKDNVTRIFEPFFTTKEVGHGTGLGLATVYGIVRQTGGFIDVKSEVGKGTTFYIYLPRAHESAQEIEIPDSVEEDMSRDLTGSERILLVEDEDAVRMFSQRALSNKGYEIISAASGEAALNLVEEQKGHKLDLLITDVVMPGMDGPTLAQRVRQTNPNLKVIFMSGYTEDKLKGYLGANTYFLPKPFTLKVLASKVKEVLAQ